MIIYWAFTFCVLILGARTFALLFVEASELAILKDTELFLHISVYFFPVLGLLCILRYTIQGAGYTNLAIDVYKRQGKSFPLLFFADCRNIPAQSTIKHCAVMELSLIHI